MARGSDGKAARKEERKEKRQKAKEDLSKTGDDDFDIQADTDNDESLPLPTPQGSSPNTTTNDSPSSNDSSSSSTNDDTPIKKKTRKKPRTLPDTPATAPSTTRSIKFGPLVLLVMLTGTTLLPALLFAGDWFGGFLAKNHIFGSLGHKLGIGPSPKKRVLSFYEKHDPLKLDEVEGILGKYHGDYPKLIKRLERKYGDYGYFLEWEKDEAPMTLAMDKLWETRDYVQKQFNVYAPQQVKIATRNIKYNISTLQRKGKKIWRRHLWPHLEPFFGVPDGGAAQKRKDRAASMDKKGTRRKSEEFRED